MSYRPVSGFPAYEISPEGEIRRIATKRVVKGWIDAGYKRIDLRRSGKSYTRKVHRLVLESFVGPAPEGTEACHRNGRKSDNRLANLYWGTHQDNMLDKVAHGNHHNAKKTHCKRGHEYSAQNTKVVLQGTWVIRQCKACNALRARIQRARKAQA